MSYLTSDQMDGLITEARSKAAPAKGFSPYWVQVDGNLHNLKTTRTLRTFLEGCSPRHGYRIFRNGMGAVTVDLDMA